MIIAYIFGNPCFTTFGNPNENNLILIIIFGNDKTREKNDKTFKFSLFTHDSANKPGLEFGLPLLVIFYSIPRTTLWPTTVSMESDPKPIEERRSKRKKREKIFLPPNLVQFCPNPGVKTGP